MRPRTLELLAKTGYLARGAVYLLVGGFAIDAALGGGGEAKDSRQALLQIVDEPLGLWMLAGIGAGLLAHASWRLVQSLADADRHGTDAKGLSIRGGLLVSAFTHFALAAWAGQLAVGRLTASSGPSGSSSSADHVAWLLGLPAGPWIVGAIAAGIAGAGVAQAVKGWTRGYAKWLAMGPRVSRWAHPVCRVGLVARGVVFVVIGSFFASAALQYDPQEAGGLREALLAVQHSPFGGPLFVAISVGLFAFGLYSILEGLYRRVSGRLASDAGRRERIPLGTREAGA